MDIEDTQIGSLLGDIDEQQLLNIYDNLDDEKVHQGIRQMVETYIGPHFEDIRGSVDEYPDPQKVRETYKNQDEDTQEEFFHDTVRDLLTLAAEIRERPREGMLRLKGYLRDPTVMEALLLIYENENINPEYRDQLKHYTATQFRLFGVMIAPEMYKRHEVEEALDIMNISQERREAVLRDYRAQQR